MEKYQMAGSNYDLSKYYPQVTFGPGVQVMGIRNVAIGRGSCISQDVWVNVTQRDEQLRMKIGEFVLIGRRGVVNTGGYLEIGAYTITGPNVYIGDVDHNYKNIYVPLILGGSTDNRSVIVEENCWLAMNSVVTGNLTVGRGSVIGANTVVHTSIPPFSVVVGNPGRVVKMFDPVAETWVSVRKESELADVMKHREQKPLPTREEYRSILDSRGQHEIPDIPEIVAGGDDHIY
jgi:acetyltransferase-like isoleucine patch superfamily enzyme